MMAKKKRDYEVGYGKPPKSSQFKKGQTGNANGKPKGARGLKNDLKAELSQKVTITENGKSVKISKQRLMVKQLVANAAKGNQPAVNKLTDLVVGILGIEDEAIKGPASLSISDQEILDVYVKSQIEGGSANDE